MHVVEWETDKSVRAVECKGRQADKVERGMNINLNHDAYYTKITDCPHDAIKAVDCVMCAVGAK